MEDDKYKCHNDIKLGKSQPSSKAKRPRVNWSNEAILKLIGLVKKEVCIWNVADTGYTNKLLRNAAWSRVSGAFKGQHNQSEILAKWSNLCIGFRINKNKTNPPWKFQNALSFIATVSARAPKSLTSMDNSSIEDSNDSALETTSISGTATTAYIQSSAPIRNASRHRTASAAPAAASASALTYKAEQWHTHSTDRDEALTTFLLSELRSLSEGDANILRCRLQRTLLEFTEERQSNLVSMDTIEHVDVKYNGYGQHESEVPLNYIGEPYDM